MDRFRCQHRGCQNPMTMEYGGESAKYCPIHKRRNSEQQKPRQQRPQQQRAEFEHEEKKDSREGMINDQRGAGNDDRKDEYFAEHEGEGSPDSAGMSLEVRVWRF